MNKTEILDHFRSLTIWKKDGQRAPNKPLLLLYALGQLRQSDRHLFSFTEVEEKLNELLAEFGPSRRKHTVADPFWRLQNDSICQVLAPEEIPPQKDSYPPLVSALRKANPQGGFADEIYALLRKDPKVFRVTLPGSVQGGDAGLNSPHILPRHLWKETLLSDGIDKGE